MAAHREVRPQGEDYGFPQQEEFPPTWAQYGASHEFTQEHPLQRDPGAAIAYQPSERTGSQLASPASSSSSRPSKPSKRSQIRSPVILAGTPEGVVGGDMPHSLSPHSDPGTFPGSPKGSDRPPSNLEYLNPPPPTTISVVDVPSVTPTPSPPPPPPKAKGSLRRLLIPTWSHIPPSDARNVLTQADTPARPVHGPSVEPVPVTVPIQPKRRGSLAERLFRNRSRPSIQEPEDPPEEAVSILSRHESYVAPDPLQRKGSFGQRLFRSRSRTAPTETEDAPSIRSRNEFPTPQSATSKKRFGLFRKTSRDVPATPAGRTFEQTESPVALGTAPTRTSVDDGASVGSQKRSRNPFNIFRKKSTASSRSTVEESGYVRAGFPPQGDQIAPSPDVFEEGDAPTPMTFGTKPKRSWADRLLGRNKVSHILLPIHQI